MAFVKEESDDMQIDKVFSLKHEDTEEQTVANATHQQEQTIVEDLSPEHPEIKALRGQLRLCKEAHAAEVEALRRELQDCKQSCASAKTALADLNTAHKQLVQTHATVVMQLTEAQTALMDAQKQLQFVRASDYPTFVDAERKPIALPAPPSGHPDLDFSCPTPEHLDTLVMRSRGRPDRFGCLLFRAVVPDKCYAEWASTTNWDGSRGKLALPLNLKQFLTKTVSQRFPQITNADIKRIKDRVNEFLRSPRKAVAHHYL